MLSAVGSVFSAVLFFSSIFFSWQHKKQQIPRRLTREDEKVHRLVNEIKIKNKNVCNNQIEQVWGEKIVNSQIFFFTENK